MKKLPRNLEKALKDLWKANEISQRCHKEIASILEDMEIDQDVLRGGKYIGRFASESLTFFDYNEGGDLQSCLGGLLEDLNTIEEITKKEGK